MQGLPYFTIPQLGPIQPFGVLVAIGVLLGAKVIYRRAERLGLYLEHARSLVLWCVVCGFIGAHVIDVLAYQQEALARDPWLILKIWAGISSFGGFIGGAVGFFLYSALGVRMKRSAKLFSIRGWDVHLYRPAIMSRPLPVALWADTFVAGLLVGMTFGRLGCTIVHDHIGRATDFPLAVNYTEQAIREHGYPIEPGLHHNLGLYEFALCAMLVGLLFLLERRRWPTGTIAGVISTGYAPVRFLMEYLRLETTDPRYFGLTFAQWTSVVTLLVGLLLLARAFIKRPSVQEAVVVDADIAKESTAAEAVESKARAEATRARAAEAKSTAAKGKAGGAAKAAAKQAETAAKNAEADAKAAEAAARAAVARYEAAVQALAGKPEAAAASAAGNAAPGGAGRKSGKKR